MKEREFSAVAWYLRHPIRQFDDVGGEEFLALLPVRGTIVVIAEKDLEELSQLQGGDIFERSDVLAEKPLGRRSLKAMRPR